MSIRTISVKPEYLSLKNKNKRNKTEKKTNLTEPININTNNIRQMLLEKLKKHKKTKKSNINVHNDNFDISNEPPYGNLKNGTKPTYRQYNINTLSSPLEKQVESNQNIPFVPIIESNQNVPFVPIIESKETLNKNQIEPLLSQSKEIIQDKPKENNIKQIKKVFTLGKNKKNKTISILINGSKTRKKIIHNREKLKKDKLTTIKNYLKKNNLIKYGTSAPSNLLKELYESSNICGEIYNTNGKTLIHNYNSDDLDINNS